MIKGYEVLEMLLPDGGWIITGNDYEGIEFINCNPITKEEFEAGFAKVKEFQALKAEQIKSAKSAILNKLGITEEEAKLLLS
jgi:hypothetical protein